MAAKVHRSSDNVFADLGFEAEEAANLQLRSMLMIQLRKRLTALGATQAQSGRVLGVSQPRVRDLLRGKIDRFSVDTLIKLLGKTGAEVRVSVRNKSRAA
jgi:predicted XRE-type DNA-binding protein